MTVKGDAIRSVLADMPGASAPEVVSEVYARFGITVADGSVRAVKSRDKARGGVRAAREPAAHRPGARVNRPGARRAPIPPEPIGLPVPDVGQYDDARYDDDGYDDDAEPAGYPTASQSAANRPATFGVTADFVVMPRAPKSVAKSQADRERQAESEVFVWMDRVESAIKNMTHGPQSVKGDRALIQLIADICDDPELRAANKSFVYDVAPTADGMFQLTITDARPVKAYRVPAERKRASAEPRCEFCPTQIPGQNLYLVNSPVLGDRPRLLCQNHATPESSVPGTTVTPYRVAFDYGGKTGVIMPEKTPMEVIRARVVSAANRIAVYPDEVIRQNYR
jgi:hypothetical protein